MLKKVEQDEPTAAPLTDDELAKLDVLVCLTIQAVPQLEGALTDRNQQIEAFIAKALRFEASLASVTSEESIVFRAIKDHHVDTLLLLLDLGFAANIADDKGNTTLHFSVDLYCRKLARMRTLQQGIWYDNSASVDKKCDLILRKLVAAGIDINVRNKKEQTPLHLIAHGPEGWKWHYDASYVEKNKMWDTLLELGADVEARCAKGETPLFTFVSRQCKYDYEVIACLEWMVSTAGADIKAKDGRGRNMLFVAEHILGRCLEWFVEHGLDVTELDPDGNTLYNRFVASNHMSIELYERLVELGLDPRLPNNDLRTPVHSFSATNNGPETAELDWMHNPLDLCTKENVDAFDKDGATAMHLAMANSEEMFRRLVGKGAEVFLYTNANQNVFHIAAKCRRACLIMELAEAAEEIYGEAGAKELLNAPDNDGRSPLWYALQAGGGNETPMALLIYGAVSDGVEIPAPAEYETMR